MDTWTITLHAQGTPLSDERTRETVLAAAHALAERFGIPIANISTAPDSLTITLETGEAAAVGFAAELRRTTNAWHESKHRQPLWITPRE